MWKLCIFRNVSETILLYSSTYDCYCLLPIITTHCNQNCFEIGKMFTLQFLQLLMMALTKCTYPLTKHGIYTQLVRCIFEKENQKHQVNFRLCFIFGINDPKNVWHVKADLFHGGTWVSKQYSNFVAPFLVADVTNCVSSRMAKVKKHSHWIKLNLLSFAS